MLVSPRRSIQELMEVKNRWAIRSRNACVARATGSSGTDASTVV
jgi:hypothetical protein